MLLHLDLQTGISGDKLLAALVDAGAPLASVNAALAAVDPRLSVAIERAGEGSLSAARLEVEYDGEEPHRDWRDVRGLLEGADLPDAVVDFAMEAFRALAEAEAKVHGVEIDDVHFHEVGAVDATADILGVAAALHALGVTRVTASAVAVGYGTVEIDHGVFPVPPPATAELLVGVPVEAGPHASELTTPTGAALLRTLEPTFGPLPPSRIAAVGYGSGTRDIGVPNVLRAMLAEPSAGSQPTDEVTVLRTVLDHLTPEESSFALERVLEEGALDAWLTPIVMKKGRCAVELTALSGIEDTSEMVSALMSLTGTLGVRVERVPRVTLERSVQTCETSLGPVRFKVAVGPDGGRRFRPEHDDCAAISRRTGLSVTDVARQVTRDAETALG